MKNKKQTAARIADDTNLGLAMLIAEDEEGHYEPVGGVVSINEAREIAVSDMKGRLRRLNRDEDPGMCPYKYNVWSQDPDGKYRVIATIWGTELESAGCVAAR